MRALLKSLLPAALVRRRLPPAAGGCVLLTFDDGPDPEATPRVLDVLAAAGARAAFFLVGRRIGRHPGIVPLIARAGHALGTHSDTHRLPPPGRRAQIRDALAGRDRLARLVVPSPRLYRPPGGHLDAAVILAARARGLRCVLWSVEGEDWRSGSEADARAVGRDLAGRIASRDIVLLHDFSRLTVPLLEILLPALAGRGLDLARGADFLEPRRFAAEEQDQREIPSPDATS